MYCINNTEYFKDARREFDDLQVNTHFCKLFRAKSWFLGHNSDVQGATYRGSSGAAFFPLKNLNDIFCWCAVTKSSRTISVVHAVNLWRLVNDHVRRHPRYFPTCFLAKARLCPQRETDKIRGTNYKPQQAARRHEKPTHESKHGRKHHRKHHFNVMTDGGYDVSCLRVALHY